MAPRTFTYLSQDWSRGGVHNSPEEGEEEAVWLSGEVTTRLAALSILVDGRGNVDVAGLALLILPDLTSLFLLNVSGLR